MSEAQRAQPPATPQSPPGFPLSVPYSLGGGVFDLIDAAKELFRVMLYTLLYTVGGNRPKGEIVNQMYQVGNRSLVFVCVTLGFLGMVLVYQICLQVNKITGDLSMVGPSSSKAWSTPSSRA